MKAALITLVAGVAISASAQGTFVNLAFEQAVVVPRDTTYGFLEWNRALPGWNGDSSSVYYWQSHVGVNPFYLLMSSTSPAGRPGALAGRYSLMIKGGTDGFVPGAPWVYASIFQTGLVPVGSKSIQLLAEGPFQLFLGGTEISMLPMGGNLYAGDVSFWAGSTTELRIRNSSFSHGVLALDNIAFSAAVVPEPSSGALAVVGTLVGWSLRKKRVLR